MKVSCILLRRDACLCCEHTLLSNGESPPVLACLLANLRSQKWRHPLFFLKEMCLSSHHSAFCSKAGSMKQNMSVSSHRSCVLQAAKIQHLIFHPPVGVLCPSPAQSTPPATPSWLGPWKLLFSSKCMLYFSWENCLFFFFFLFPVIYLLVFPPELVIMSDSFNRIWRGLSFALSLSFATCYLHLLPPNSCIRKDSELSLPTHLFFVYFSPEYLCTNYSQQRNQNAELSKLTRFWISPVLKFGADLSALNVSWTECWSVLSI